MIKIREAKREDVPKLCELLHQLFSQEIEFNPEPKLQSKALEQIIEDENLGVILVAQKKDEVIGMCNLLFTFSTALGDRVILFEDMIVDEKHRGLGVGSALVKEAKEYAQENGFLRITLLSDDDNEKAHAFYERHDFKDSPRKVFTCKL